MTTHHAKESQAERPPFGALGAAALSLALLAGGLLWYRFGESIYIDRLLTAVANCF